MLDNFDIIGAELNPYIVYCLCNEDIISQIPGKPYDSRVTRYHELELITGGNGYMMINGKNYTLKRGDLYYHPPGTKITGTRPYGYIIILFDPYFGKEKMSQYKEGKKALGDVANEESKVSRRSLPLPLHMDVTNYNFYKALFNKIFTHFVEGSSILEVKITLMELIHELKKEHLQASGKMTNSLTSKSYYKKIMSCAQIIDTTPQVNYTLGDLAREIELSKNFLCSAFKEIMGTTIFSYIHIARIKRAKDMLIQTQSSIEEIAYCCGFENLSYFYRTFKKYSGVSPANYRNHYRL
jgi:YesN/AraC family two-component response regulator